jgi:dTDP-4-dehydrorhamnose 3,5-epimerase
MKLAPRRLAGTFDVLLAPHRDERGDFLRWYDEGAFGAAGLPTRWVQGNESLSRRNVVRGLHFQRAPHSETKLVRATAGAVFDVFVDLRGGSSTYGEWDSVVLSRERCNAVLVPKGFAHGFCALEDLCIVSYLVDSAYAPESEGGLAWDDPQLAIRWPLEGEAIVSPKDRRWPRLAELEPL